MEQSKKRKANQYDLETNNDTNNSGSNPVDTNNCSKGCLTLTRPCYCDGVLSDESECPLLDLPLNDTLNCTLNCDCKWTNESEWSLCNGGTQYLTRECSCSEAENDVPTLDSSYSYSYLCNGFTRIARTCTTNALSVQSWKNATWPEEDDTKLRTFNCSSLTWFELINLSNFSTPWEELAVEYIAAQLNILSGVSTEPSLNTDLESTQSLLNECEWTSDQSQQAKDLLSNLQTFNTEYSSNNLESDNANNANYKTSQNGSQTLLLAILIPALVLAIAAIIAAVILIRKKLHEKQEASNA
jgi:hypothetical protein